ncbi:MAG TPA: tetratricopeptide repeat protein [Sedimentisphaerales bacterium]|jgi:tetratricopeptide (TPR) repeat protein|nr:tetratricopeptide repeat protein [Sedimentisphaerales bacterium]HNU29710.1 tetratricopeptide repeat protein [Sedimentisphaerales bacterium]
MKRVLLSVVILLLLSPRATFGERIRLANAGKAGLNVTSLEQVLRLSEDEIDLATATLIASEYWSDVVAGRRYLDELDAMATEILKRLRQQRLPVDSRAIPIINQYLFEELGFQTIAHADDPNDLFLHSVMDRQQGYCLSLSILYLSIAERLGLDVYGVVVPGHFFVRYEKGRVRFNIETTSNGASPPDEHYRTRFNVPEGGRDSIYMKSLNKRQSLGCFFNNLGNVYSEIGDVNTAMVALERAVAINPTLSESRANLGNIYLQKNRVNEAIRQYRAALDLNPRDPKTHNNLGNAYMAIDELNAAASAYRQAIHLDSSFVDAYRNMALLLTRQERYSQAMSQLNLAMALDSENAQIYNQFGELYCRMHEYDKGLSQFRRAANLKPDSAEAYYGMGICHGGLKQTDAEIQSYMQALTLKPTMLAALIDLGTAYFNQGQYDLAVQYYRQAAAVKPDDSRILFNLGSAYLKKEQWDLAVEAYLRVVRMEPQTGDAHHALAYAFYRLGNFEQAWAYANTAKRLGTKIPEDLLNAIQSRLKQAARR